MTPNLPNNPSAFDDAPSHFTITGPVGAIECRSHSPVADHPANACVVICHPHPLHGGTMDNKVVSTLERCYRELGLRTVRFNFRGVGLSAGVHDDGIGEVDDVMALVSWLNEVRPGDAIVLAGFSFGSYVALQAAQHIDCAHLSLIAPAVTRWRFDRIQMPRCPWTIVMGERDEIVEPQAVFDWVGSLASQPSIVQPQLVRMPETSHFFHGKLIELRQVLQTTLRLQLPNRIHRIPSQVSA